MPWAAAPEEILGVSGKQILMPYPTSTLWDISNGYPYMIVIKEATACMIFSGATLLSVCRSCHGMICQEEKAVIEKKMAMEKILYTAGFTTFQIPQNKVITFK